MCRFLIVKSETPIKPQPFLKEFALMCQKSRTPDGDRQEDGYGIAIKNKNQHWQVYKSLKPIWENQDSFNQFPQTDLFLAHARSASFPDQKGILTYNQPYVKDDLAFVFNGMIQGVKLNQSIPGKIGAQKIFYLLQQELKSEKSLPNALRTVHQLLKKSSRQLTGFNLGLANFTTAVALCNFQQSQDYFTLHYHKSQNLAIICSEPIGDYKWQPLRSGQTIIL